MWVLGRFDVSLFRPQRTAWQFRVGGAYEGHPGEALVQLDLGPWQVAIEWSRRHVVAVRRPQHWPTTLLGVVRERRPRRLSDDDIPREEEIQELWRNSPADATVTTVHDAWEGERDRVGTPPSRRWTREGIPIL